MIRGLADSMCSHPSFTSVAAGFSVSSSSSSYPPFHHPSSLSLLWLLLLSWVSWVAGRTCEGCPELLTRRSITAVMEPVWKWLKVLAIYQNGWDLLLVRGSGGGWRCRRMWRLLLRRYAHSQQICSEASPESILIVIGHIWQKPGTGGQEVPWSADL